MTVYGDESKATLIINEDKTVQVNYNIYVNPYGKYDRYDLKLNEMRSLELTERYKKFLRNTLPNSDTVFNGTYELNVTLRGWENLYDRISLLQDVERRLLESRQIKKVHIQQEVLETQFGRAFQLIENDLKILFANCQQAKLRKLRIADNSYHLVLKHCTFEQVPTQLIDDLFATYDIYFSLTTSKKGDEVTIHFGDVRQLKGENDELEQFTKLAHKLFPIEMQEAKNDKEAIDAMFFKLLNNKEK